VLSFIRNGAVLASLLMATLTGACGSGGTAPIIRHPVDAGHHSRDAGPASGDGGTTCFGVADGGGVDCGGSADEIHACIINAPTKSGILVTVPKPVINYQTCMKESAQ
jgi:hypothetical protein